MIFSNPRSDGEGIARNRDVVGAVPYNVYPPRYVP